MTRKPAISIVLLLAAFLALQQPILGQVPPALLGQSGGAAEAVDDALGTAPEPAAPVLVGRLSPRATMRTFLEAFPRRDWDAAIACLDLSHEGLSPAALRLRGREAATTLKDVIDRLRYVDFGDIPAEPDGAAYVFHSGPAGGIVIERQPNGEWLFSAATIAAIPTLLRELGDTEIVEGVEEAPRTLALWIRSWVPESLAARAFILEGWQWAGLLLLTIVGVALDRIVVLLAAVAARRWISREQRNLTPGAVTSAVRPLGLLAMATFWWAGLGALGLPGAILESLLLASRFAAIVAVVWTTYRAADLAAEILAERAKATEGRTDDLLVPLVRKSLKVFVTAFGLVFIADNLDVNVSSLLAGLGLGGIAIALAAQDTIKNLFGSITVLFDRPFSVGDWVVIEDTEGTVEELGFRSTRIRTFYNSVITLPNATLIDAAVDNYGSRTYRRWKTVLSLTWDTPPDKIEAFCEGARELIRRHPYTRKDYYHVYLNDFGASDLQVLLYMFFNTPDWSTELRERHRLGVDILRLAQALGVSFAFPTRTVLLKQDDAEPTSPPPPTPLSAYVTEREDALEAGRRAARELAQRPATEEPPPAVDFSSFPGA